MPIADYFRCRGALVALALAAGASIVASCDFSPASPTPTPASATAPQAVSTPVPTAEGATPVSTLAGDGQIDTGALYHDSRDPAYRTPGGAVKGGTAVTLRLKTKPDDLSAAQVRIWNTRTETETLISMHPTAPDIWEATLDTPTDGAALYYRFVAHDGTAEGYYNDDAIRDGGSGEGKSYNSDTDYVITAYRPDFTTPKWLKDAVVYQIFPDRFNNGDPTNDKPDGTFIYGGKTIKRQWGDAPTGGNDFFGGDLKGITQKLDFLKSLGVTAIYFNPIFKSPSNHRYDTTDYTLIDPALGTLDDFRTLVKESKARGIHLILDGVFNHSSSDSIYFDKYKRYPTVGAAESQQSPYFPWYKFTSWPSKYRAWSNVDSLPVLTESDAVEQFFFTGSDPVVKRWLNEGISGWRLDAAEQKSHEYWRVARRAIKAIDPDAVIIGEFWHDSSAWLAGDQWDGTMNYRFNEAVLAGWLNNPARDVKRMVSELDAIREDYPPQALAASMNLLDSHDTARALTTVGDNKNLLKLMAVMQFTWPGLPTVYYGDEAGMVGGGDPDCRRTYPWGSEDKSLIEFYSMLARLRHEHPALSTGEYINLGYDNAKDVYVYARKDSASVAVVGVSRNKDAQEIEVPVSGVIADGTTVADVLTDSGEYRVEGGKLKVHVPGESAVLLMPK